MGAILFGMVVVLLFFAYLGYKGRGFLAGLKPDTFEELLGNGWEDFHLDKKSYVAVREYANRKIAMFLCVLCDFVFAGLTGLALVYAAKPQSGGWVLGVFFFGTLFLSSFVLTGHYSERVAGRAYKRALEMVRNGGVFGKARAANLAEIRAAEFNHEGGLYVGRIWENKESCPNLFYGGDRHAVTIAPNGSGKGRTVLIPHFAHYQDSIITTDIKGENALMTARWRRDVLGQEVFILNPFGLFREEFAARGFRTSARCNPLAWLDVEDPNFTVNLDAIASALLPMRDPRHSFWIQSARNIVAGYLLYLCETKEPHARNIADLYGFLKRAQVCDSTFKDDLEGMLSKSSERVFEELSCLVNPTEKIGEFISNALSELGFLRDTSIRESLHGADFDFRDFKRRPMTVYLVLPPDSVDTRATWLRLLVSSALSALTSEPADSGRNVLFLLDEFPVLGHMENIAKRFALVRGYGVKFWLVVQGLEQLKEHYPQGWEKFIQNSGVQQFFTPNDLETAEYISRRSGQRTITVESTSTGADGKESVNAGLTGAPLWTPQDILGMPSHEQIIFTPGLQYPIKAVRGNYDENPAYQGLDANPYISKRGV